VNTALARLLALPLGTRVVIRYRLDGGTTDALGELVARDLASFTVSTRTGEVQVPAADVQLAKPVPPPPARRERRVP